MTHHQEEYNSYWKQTLGEYRSVPTSTFYINQYIEQNNLRQDLNHFINEQNHLFYINKDKKAIVQEIISKVISPIFDEIRYNYIYIYRQTDHKGLLAQRR